MGLVQLPCTEGRCTLSCASMPFNLHWLGPLILVELSRTLSPEVIGSSAGLLSDLTTTCKSITPSWQHPLMSVVQSRTTCRKTWWVCIWIVWKLSDRCDGQRFRCSQSLAQFWRLVDMVLSRATIEGGREIHEAQGGINRNRGCQWLSRVRHVSQCGCGDLRPGTDRKNPWSSEFHSEQRRDERAGSRTQSEKQERYIEILYSRGTNKISHYISGWFS